MQLLNTVVVNMYMYMLHVAGSQQQSYHVLINLCDIVYVHVYICVSDAGVEGAAVIKKKRIRRQSLRYFYGNSVSSPNLTEVPSSVIKVRRSPRLIGERSTCTCCVCHDLAGCINLQCTCMCTVFIHCTCA